MLPFAAVAGLIAAPPLSAEPTISIDVSGSLAPVSPLFNGLMTEEINHSYDGGLYAELVQNRAFMDDPAAPVHWSAVQDKGSAARISLDHAQPLNSALPVSLRLDAASASASAPAGIANEGFWGIPVTPDTKYRASFFAKTAPGFSGSVTVAIQSEDGGTVYAQADVPAVAGEWKKYDATLETGKLDATTKARLVLTVSKPGTVWFSLVSLFPPTWNDRPNGLRKDLMQMLVDLKPKFLRCPGGNYLEGETIETRFPWKKTLGPLEQRPGHQGCWTYRSSDGMGLLEFMEWAEDMGAEPVLAVYAGYSLQGGFVKPGPDLEPYVQDALDEIEYVAGSADTKWGAERVKDGHPAPFKLEYVEIGNEDFFDKSGTYDGRFTQIYDAIKAKYPQLKCIATVGFEHPADQRVHSRKPDAVDEHYYDSAANLLKKAPEYYAQYDRSRPSIFVGEWAAFEDIVPWDRRSMSLPPTPSMKAALADAAWMAGMERNADLVIMNCYAPLLVNVNPGAYQWRPNLIGYDGLHVYGSPSYYAIKLFSQNIGDTVLKVTAAGSPVQASATRDSKTREIIVKLVNPQADQQTVKITLDGVGPLAPEGTAFTLSGGLDDTNSMAEPNKIVPVESQVRGIGPDFDYVMPAHSIVVMKLKAG